MRVNNEKIIAFLISAIFLFDNSHVPKICRNTTSGNTLRPMSTSSSNRVAAGLKEHTPLFTPKSSSAGEAQAEEIRKYITDLESGDLDVRRSAAFALGNIGPSAKAAVPALIKALGDEEWHVRSSAASALGNIGPVTEDVIPALIKALGDEDSGIRSSAAFALGKIGKDAVPALIKALGNEERKVRSSAAEALGNIGPVTEDVIPALIKALGDEDSDVRKSAAEALGNKGSDAIKAIPALTKLKEDSDSQLEFLNGLGAFRCPENIEQIRQDLLNVSNAVKKALDKIKKALDKINPLPDTVSRALDNINGVIVLDDIEDAVKRNKFINDIIKTLRRNALLTREDWGSVGNHSILHAEVLFTISEEIQNKKYVFDCQEIKVLPGTGGPDFIGSQSGCGSGWHLMSESFKIRKEPFSYGGSFRGTLFKAPDDAEGSVRLDPPSNSKFLVQEYINILRLLSLGFNPNKELILQDSVKAMFASQGIILPDNLTIGGFVEAVKAAESIPIVSEGQKPARKSAKFQRPKPKVVEEILTKTHVRYPATITNRLGLHVRVASAIEGLIKSSKSTATIAKGPKTADAGSLKELTKLAAEEGDEVIIETKGEDAMEVAVKIEEILKDESVLGNIGSVIKSSSAGDTDQEAQRIMAEIRAVNEAVYRGDFARNILPSSEFGPDAGRDNMTLVAVKNYLRKPNEPEITLPGVGIPKLEIIEENGRIVGYMIYGTAPADIQSITGDSAYIFFMAAHPDARDRKLGEELFKKVAAFAREHGKYKLALNVNKDNSYKAFYDRMGGLPEVDGKPIVLSHTFCIPNGIALTDLYIYRLRQNVSATKSSSAGKVDRKGTVYSADDSGRRQEYLISAIVPKKIKQEHIASKIILTAA